MFNGKIPNINNLSGMRTMDKYLILIIPGGDMGEKAWKTILRLWPAKRRTSTLS
jgi:hypothetical protein